VEYLEAIQHAINTGFNCNSRHLKTVPVHLKHEGKTMWDGKVEVFEIIGHPRTKTCYAWGFRTDEGNFEFATVLELPPVDSPENAVKAYLVSQNK
jgi:hypothetical protein